LLRFWNLDQWSLWIDEAYTLADAYHGVGNYNWVGYRLVRWTVEALGEQPSAWSLRFLPALVGWLCIPATFWALHPWVGGRRAALVALVVALSPWELYWSQNARFYTFVQLSSLIGAGYVLRGLLRNSVALAIWGLALSGFGALFQLQAVIVSVALVAGPLLAWIRFKGWRSPEQAGDLAGEWVTPTRVIAALVLFATLAGLTVLPWVLDIFQQYRLQKQDPPLASLQHLVLTSAYYITPTLSAAALFGSFVIWRTRDARGLVLAGVVLSGAGALAAASVLARTSAQYGLAFLPFISVLAVWVTAMPGIPCSRILRWGFVTVICAPLLAGLGLYFTTQQGQRPRWREAYLYVQAQRATEDIVLGMQAPVGEFYLVPGSTNLRLPEAVRWCDRTRPAAWRKAAQTDSNLWVVVRPAFLPEWGADARQAFERFLRDDCELQRSFPVRQEGRDLNVDVYLRRAQRP